MTTPDRAYVEERARTHMNILTHTHTQCTKEGKGAVVAGNHRSIYGDGKTPSPSPKKIQLKDKNGWSDWSISNQVFSLELVLGTYKCLHATASVRT